jgi:hypothetical protein
MKHKRNGVIGTVLGLACVVAIAFPAAAQVCGSKQTRATDVSLQTIQCNSCSVGTELTLGQLFTLSAYGNKDFAHAKTSSRDANGLECVNSTKD